MNTYPPAKKYVQTMSEIQTDLCIWKSVIEKSIADFQIQLDPSFELFSSSFSAYKPCWLSISFKTYNFQIKERAARQWISDPL